MKLPWATATWRPAGATDEQPYHWRKPRHVQVAIDLFDGNCTPERIARAWQVMATTPQHTYLITTRHAGVMRDWVTRCKESRGGWITHDATDPGAVHISTGIIVGYPHPPQSRPGADDRGPRGGKPRHRPMPVAWGWPLPNVILAAQVTLRAELDEALSALLDTPAACRALWCEPMTGSVDLGPGEYLHCGNDALGHKCRGCVVDWVICGGDDSGAAARPVHPDWVRALRDQCQYAGVPFTFTGWGGYLPVPVEDAPGMLGGRAYRRTPHGGQTSATIRERSAKAFRGGVVRLMRPGDENGFGRLLDADTMALRVRGNAAGRELDGVTWDQAPELKGSSA